MAPYLSPIERPGSLLVKIVYFFTRRQFGKVSTPVSYTHLTLPTNREV